MDILEKSKEYAAGKALDAMTATIAEAYAAGYKEGYNEALSKFNAVAPALAEDSLVFVNLGVPDNTLWATDYLRAKDGSLILCTYDEAKLLGIPTNGQFTMMRDLCKHEMILPSDSKVSNFEYVFSGSKGSIRLYNQINFWVKGPVMPEDTEAFCVVEGMRIERAARNRRLPVLLIREGQTSISEKV